MNLLAVISSGADQKFLPETEVCFELLKLLLKYITMQNALFAGIKYNIILYINKKFTRFMSNGQSGHCMNRAQSLHARMQQ